MGESGLRRKTSYLIGLVLLACGGLAGAALAGGTPAGLLPTTVLPTIGLTTSVSVPSVTVTVPTPTVTVTTPVTTATVSTPTVSTPTVTTPTVTTPAVTAPALPPVTTAVAATVAVPSVTATLATPVGTVKTPPSPTATVAVSVSAQPSVSVSAAVPPATSAVTGIKRTSVEATVQAPSAGGHTSVGVGALTPGSAPEASPTTVFPVSQAHVALPVLSGAIRGGGSPAGPGIDARSGTRYRDPPATGVASVLSPLGPQVAAPPGAPEQGDSASGPQVQPAVRPAPGWSGTDTRRAAAAGGLAALLALGAVGLAAAARSSTLVAACHEVSRFPFPRFRIVPCPGPGRSAGGGVAAGIVHHPAAAPGTPDVSGRSSATTAAAGDGSGVLLPRIGGVLGAAVTKTHPLAIVKALAFALLAFANALLLGIRWRIGRLHAR